MRTAQGDNETGSEDRDELQFDQAEFTTPLPTGTTCAGCKRPIPDLYYETNGKIVCPTCRQQIEASFRGGSRLLRVMKAFLLGSVGAAAGAVLYYVILRVTNINFGLVAVVVGFMVGGAVKRGSGNRGGAFYQALALFLTYTAIAAMLAPFAVEQYLKNAQENGQPEGVPAAAPQNVPANLKVPPPAAQAPAVAKAKPPAAKVPPPVAKATADAKVQPPAAKDPPPAAKVPAVARAEPPAAKVQPAPMNPAPAKQAAADQKDGTNPQQNGEGAQAGQEIQISTLLAGLLFFVVLVIGFFYALPVVVGFGDPISGLIYCFALWEAWKINKAAKLVFSGPFRVSPEGPAAAKPEVVDDDV